MVGRVLASMVAGVLLAAQPGGAVAAPVTPQESAQALDMLKRGIAFRTVAGKGNQVPAYAAYLKDQLVAGGFPAADISITPFEDTAVLLARWRGTGAKAKPIILSGHMDVVEADPKDWTRDPFTAVVENGFVYGRGSLDNKAGITVMVATLTKLRREGFRPRRDIVLALSGAEETSFKSTKLLAGQLKGAELLLNSDAGGAAIDDKTGKPQVYGIQAAEKTYADYRITITDPGGHSSRPTATNPITALAKSIEAISAYAFPVQSSELTRAFFRATATQTPGDMGEAMKRFAANPDDAGAAATLSAAPEWVGQLRTTCVPTMLDGGHAPNALPQRASVLVNCRIYPGVSIASVGEELAKLAGPRAKIEVVGDQDMSDASPLRADVMAALRKAVDARAPGLPIVPMMEAGATDSVAFRALGIPSYGVGPVFIKAGDEFAHGLNERVPVESISGGIAQWTVLVRELAK